VSGVLLFSEFIGGIKLPADKSSNIWVIFFQNVIFTSLAGGIKIYLYSCLMWRKFPSGKEIDSFFSLRDRSTWKVGFYI
jgi:hypothetical protein